MSGAAAPIESLEGRRAPHAPRLYHRGSRLYHHPHSVLRGLQSTARARHWRPRVLRGPIITVGRGGSRSVVKEVGLHPPLALDLALGLLFGREAVAHEGVGPLAHIDTAGLRVGAHARRRVDRIAAQVVLESLVSDDAGYGEAAVDAHLYTEGVGVGVGVG